MTLKFSCLNVVCDAYMERPFISP